MGVFHLVTNKSRKEKGRRGKQRSLWEECTQLSLTRHPWFTDSTYYIVYYTALWVHECVFAEEAVWKALKKLRILK